MSYINNFEFSNKVYDLLKSHRSIRFFNDDKLKSDEIKKLFDAFRTSASSVGLQQASLIRITDPNLKLEISKVFGQDYVGTAPELFIFIVDLFRNMSVLKEMGKSTDNIRSLDRFIQGFTDAIIGAQSIEIMAESMGLGTVYLGSILNDYDRIIDLLNLPELTFPAVGMAIGHPKDRSILKPKMNNEIRIFENEYKIFPSYKELLNDYSNELSSYKDLREGGKNYPTFFELLDRFFASKNEKRMDVIKALKRQGFDA